VACRRRNCQALLEVAGQLALERGLNEPVTKENNNGLI